MVYVVDHLVDEPGDRWQRTYQGDLKRGLNPGDKDWFSIKGIVHAEFLPSFRGMNIINNVIQGMCERVPDKISRSGKIWSHSEVRLCQSSYSQAKMNYNPAPKSSTGIIQCKWATDMWRKMPADRQACPGKGKDQVSTQAEALESLSKVRTRHWRWKKDPGLWESSKFRPEQLCQVLFCLT